MPPKLVFGWAVCLYSFLSVLLPEICIMNPVLIRISVHFALWPTLSHLFIMTVASHFPLSVCLCCFIFINGISVNAGLIKWFRPLWSKFCGWKQRGEFHVFNIDNQVKALPLFFENSVFSDRMLIIKKKNRIKGKQDLSRKDNEAVYGVVFVSATWGTHQNKQSVGSVVVQKLITSIFTHLHVIVGHWRRNESEYKNCRRCISTSPYTRWLLTKIIRFLCVGFTSSSLSSLMAKESRIIRVARQRFGNLVKAS